MKRVVKLFSFVLFLMLFFVPESVSAKAAIRMYEPDTMMLVETTKQLSLVKVTSATSYKEIKKGITWTSNDEGVATVDEKGVVTFKTLTYTDQDEITLNNSFPMTDANGATLTPYQFTVKNVCENTQYYEVNLETLSTSTADMLLMLTTKSNKHIVIIVA